MKFLFHTIKYGFNMLRSKFVYWIHITNYYSMFNFNLSVAHIDAIKSSQRLDNSDKEYSKLD